MTDNREPALRAILAFYQEAGVDAVLTESPIDRLAERAAAEQAVSVNAAFARAELPRPASPIATSPIATLAPDAAVAAARAAAKAASSLDELKEMLRAFEGCALSATATQLVFADGNPQSRVMFVGEAPGREEDIQGLPFVGRSGQLLDRMLAAIGLSRQSAYIANIVPWRPPGNRTPTPQESAICLPFTLRQIELADPDLLVCLGTPSAQTLLNIAGGIVKNRGRWFRFHTGTREVRALATFHPAYLLRQPLQKRLVWRDFLAIKKALTGPTAGAETAADRLAPGSFG